MKVDIKKQFLSVSLPILLISGVGLALLLLRFIVSGSERYWFLPWNLFLAWVPLMLSFAAVLAARKHRWTSWQFIVAMLAWLIFFPNTFYIVTDLIHIHSTGEVSIVYDVVMMSLFVTAGTLLGFVSLFLIEKELRRGLKPRIVTGCVLAVILLSSFAIYLGRYLRWNSWDVVTSPGALLLDTADRIFRPYDHPLAVTTTLLFFVSVAGLYYGLKYFIRAAKKLD